MKILDIKSNDNVAKKFAEALHESGFVVLTNTGIEQCEIESMYSNWLNFFYKDEESKLEFLYDKN